MEQATITERLATLRSAVATRGSEDVYVTFTHDGEEIVAEVRVDVVDLNRGTLEGSEYGGQEIVVPVAGITEIFVG